MLCGCYEAVGGSIGLDTAIHPGRSQHHRTLCVMIMITELLNKIVGDKVRPIRLPEAQSAFLSPILDSSDESL